MTLIAGKGEAKMDPVVYRLGGTQIFVQTLTGKVHTLEIVPRQSRKTELGPPSESKKGKAVDCHPEDQTDGWTSGSTGFRGFLRPGM